MKTFLKYIYVIELLLFSGSVCLSVLYPKLCLIIWVFTALLLILACKEKNLEYNRNVIIAIVSWILIVQFITTTSDFDNKYLTYILFPLGSIALSQFSFNDLRYKLLSALSWLCVFSIIAQVGYDFLNLPAKIVYDSNFGQSWTMIFGVFNVNWGGESLDTKLHRMSSIYWEPGEFQIVCFYVLCLFADKLTTFTSIKSIDKRFWPILVSILYSQSTMGYLVLALFIAMIILFRKTEKRSIKNYISTFLILLISIIGVYALTQSSVVQDKLEQREYTQYDNSYNIRMIDNISCLNATLDSPIFGYGINTDELNSRLLSLGNHTASNGWLLTSASLGIPFIILLFYLMYKRLKEFKSNIPRVFLMAILIIAQCNEASIFFPYIYLYIFKTNDKKKCCSVSSPSASIVKKQ